MLKLTKRTTPRITIEVTGDTVREVVGAAAALDEVASDRECGVCGSENLRFRHRITQNKKKQRCDYYESVCTDCGARLHFGINMEGGTLFAKRKLNAAGLPDMEAGAYGKHNGWTKAMPARDDE